MVEQRLHNNNTIDKQKKFYFNCPPFDNKCNYIRYGYLYLNYVINYIVKKAFGDWDNGYPTNPKHSQKILP